MKNLTVKLSSSNGRNHQPFFFGGGECRTSNAYVILPLVFNGVVRFVKVFILEDDRELVPIPCIIGRRDLKDLKMSIIEGEELTVAGISTP